MEDDPLMLRDIVPAEPLIQHPGLPWWVIALIALVAALILTWIVAFARRKSSTSIAPPVVDREAAYRAAKEQIEEAVGLPAREAATRISGAIRLYLSKVCKDPSLFETHEEFVGRHEALSQFPEVTREHVSVLLTRLADLKYDRPAESPAEGIEQQPLHVLRQIHQEVPA